LLKEKEGGHVDVGIDLKREKIIKAVRQREEVRHLTAADEEDEKDISAHRSRGETKKLNIREGQGDMAWRMYAWKASLEKNRGRLCELSENLTLNIKTRMRGVDARH